MNSKWSFWQRAAQVSIEDVSIKVGIPNLSIGQSHPLNQVKQIDIKMDTNHDTKRIKIGVQLCLMTSPLIQEKLSHGLLFRLTLLRDIRKTYAPIMSDVPVRYIYMHQFFSAYI